MPQSGGRYATRLPWPSNRTPQTPGFPRATPCLDAVRAAAFGTSPSWALTSFGSRFPNSVLLSKTRRVLPGLRCGYRFRLFVLLLAPWHVFALINPALHSDNSVRGVRLSRPVINICAQRLQRQASLQIPFLARDFRAVQTTRHTHLDSLASETQRRIDRFAHRSPECHALFQLQRNRFRHQRGVQLRTMHFHDIDVHFALGPLADFLLQLVDFRTLAPDDNSRASRGNPHHQLVGRAFDINRTDSRALQLVLQLSPQLDVLMQQFRVIAVCIPARLPGLVVAQAKPVRVCFLSHYFFPFFFAATCFPVNALRTRRAVPRTPLCDSASARLAATRSAAAM